MLSVPYSLPLKSKIMADKRMNQFTPATDMEYVYAELADGS